MESQRITYLSAIEASRVLGVSTQTLRKWHREGILAERGLNPIKRHNRWYYLESELVAFSQSNN